MARSLGGPTASLLTFFRSFATFRMTGWGFARSAQDVSSLAKENDIAPSSRRTLGGEGALLWLGYFPMAYLLLVECVAGEREVLIQCIIFVYVGVTRRYQLAVFLEGNRIYAVNHQAELGS